MRTKLKPVSSQTIVITGATSGIGLATARKAAAQGANVFLIARSERDLQSVASELASKGAGVDWCVADVGEAGEIAAAADKVIARFGGFDTWVNNAGVGVYGDALDVPMDDHERVFRTNYWGVVNGSTVAARHLRTGSGGALVNVGSIVSDIPAPQLACYAASKHAVKGYTDTLRMELAYARAPVSVTLIKPSGIQTPFAAHARNHMGVEPRIPPPAYAPDLVADAILYAAANGGREITVGAAGKVLTTLTMALPALATGMLPAMMTPMQQDKNAQRSPFDSLFAPSGDNRIYADQGPTRSFDLYTAMRTHPRLATGLALTLAAGLMAQRRAAARALAR